MAPVGMAFPGFNGIINVPNALVTSEGKVDLQFNNQLETIFGESIPSPKNYLFSLGLLPNLELGGRLAVRNDPTLNRGIILGGTRDLSGNFKLRIPLSAALPSIAIGVQDFAGAARNYRARYIVLSETLFNSRLSAGFGFGPDRLDGLFGGIEFPLNRQISVLAENDTVETNLGFRVKTNLFANTTTEILAKIATDATRNQRAIGLGISLNLGKNYRDKKSIVHSSALSHQIRNNIVLTPNKTHSTSSDAKLSIESLINQLHFHGFEYVNIGHQGHDYLVIEAENTLYNQNLADALGVILGIAVNDAADSDFRYVTVYLKKQGGNLVTATVNKDIYYNFLQDPTVENQLNGNNLQFKTEVALENNINWLHRDRYRRNYIDVIFFPHMRSFVGTEIGVVDYSIALRTQLQVPLWSGSSITSSFDIPIDASKNFNDKSAFSAFKHTYRMQDLFLHQLYQPWRFITNLSSLGQITVDNDEYIGVFNETLWHWGNEGHRLRLKVSHLESGTSVRNMWIAGARYSSPSLYATFDTSFGQYWYGDRGVEVSASRFFGDTQVTLFYKNNVDQAGGLRFSLPLTGRRDFNAGPVTIRGTSRWEYGLQTSIEADATTNPINTGILVDIKPFYSLEKDFFDSGRLSSSYLKINKLRMRDAFIKYAKTYHE